MVVIDNPDANRFEVHEEGEIAVLDYERRGRTIVFTHTLVPESLRGRGIATELARAGLESARKEGLAIVAQCPVVREYLRKHQDAI